MAEPSQKPAQPIGFPELYRELRHADAPATELIRAGFDAIFANAWSSEQVVAFAILMDRREMTADILTSGAQALRNVMLPADVEPLYLNEPTLVDTCGTGGDGLHTLNISTAAAMVLATTGVRVAKHGNRSASGHVGSADVLEALGIPVDIPVQAHAAIAEQTNITFLFAPTHHPALQYAANARKKLRIRTIFNLLGPLVNPAPVTHQLVGVSDDALRHPMAESLRRLGVSYAWVVHGADGMDELSPCGPTHVTVLDGMHVSDRVLTPQDFGLDPISPDALKGGTAVENAQILERILRGEPHPARNAVLLNAAAAALLLFPEKDSRVFPDEARADRLDKIVFMKRAIDEGRVWKKLEDWRRAAAPYAKPRP